MKNIKQRIKSAVILLAILIPFLLIVYFGKIAGKVIGVSFYAIITTWAVYEVLSHSVLKKWQNVLIAILSSVIWMMPFDWYQIPVNTANIPNQEDSSSFLYLAKHTGISITEVAIQIKKAIFFSTDTLTNFRALQISIIIIFISLIYLINLFVLKKPIKQKMISYFIAIFATWFIPLSFKTLFIYNASSLYFLFAIIIIPVVTDSFAYFGGSLLGKKLIKVGFAPKISPKKSWEGVFIGFLFGALFVFITMYLGHLTNNQKFVIFKNWKQLLAGIFLLPTVSIIGDLAFSGIKRLYEIKDFSNLIPGHGGYMDRFDSTSFVVLMTSAILFIN